jgi:16S rRNA (guanine1516-N2)-methyltransferase
MYETLKAGMQEALDKGGDTAEVIGRMTLLHGDAKLLLPELSPEIILVDPMHPARKNSALVKKEMRLIREIVGTDEDSVELMKVALEWASKRVVLKWPQKADPMAGIKAPSHQIPGKTTRYDVFMIKGNI